MSVVLGVFDDRDSTEGAIEALVRGGIPEDAIGVIWRDREVEQPDEITVVGYEPHHDSATREAGKGAVGGAIGGAATGTGAILLASAGIAILPGIGALLAAGTAAAAAAAAATGAVGGGVAGGAIGALIGATDNDATETAETRRRIRNTIQRDGFVLSIDLDDSEVTIHLASDAMRDAGANDISVLDGDDSHLKTLAQ